MLKQIPHGPVRLNRSSPQARGLVGWWPGYVDAGQRIISDYSGYAHHAAWSGTSVGSISSEFGVVVPSMAGTSDNPVGDAEIPQLQGASNASLSIWWRRPATNEYSGIGYGEDSASRFHLAAWDTSAVYATVNGAFSNATLNDTEWHHGVITFDGTQATANNRVVLYIDGEVPSRGSASYPTALGSKSGNRIRLGYPVGVTIGDGAWFDARAYDRTLSGAEVVEQYYHARWDLWDAPRKSVRYFIPSVEAGGFQPAWAANATTTIAGGITT